ncbi:MAG: glycosyltransferase family 4 protein [Anaerolineales bacterium]|nr:glycosyltransferase family 4 protein [Anaerolineales bacterium]
MHILLIHQAFAALGEPGGTRHHEIARHLRANGHDVTILASTISYLAGERLGDERIEVDDAGVVIRRCYTYSGYHRSFFHRVLGFFSFMLSSFFAALAVKKVDLVWGTSPPIFQGVTAWVIARLKRVPYLFEVRDLWPLFAIAVGVLDNPILISLSRWLERFLYSRADRVIVNSPGYLEHVRMRGARFVDLVPNGVEVAMFFPDERGAAFREEHHLGDGFLAFYAGAHGLSNDLDVVLEAASILRERKDIHFVLVGDGKEKRRLLKVASTRGINNVVFIPPIPKNHMPVALAAADACIAILKPIDVYKLTYPNKVFDYMAAGRPVVLAIDGVVREVVEKGQAGIYSPPGDPAALALSVSTLADDPEMRLRMGKAGRLYVMEHFDRPQLSATITVIMQKMCDLSMTGG